MQNAKQKSEFSIFHASILEENVNTILRIIRESLRT